jgi:hypothetical protein
MCLYSCLCYPGSTAHVPYYIVISGLSGSTIFFHILINGTIFGKKLLNMKCVFCLKHFSFQEEFSGVLSQTYIGHHVKYPLVLTHFKRNLNFLHRFSKKPQISNFMKIRPVGVELFHKDRYNTGQTVWLTDMTKLIVAFRSFANAPKNVFHKAQASHVQVM